MYLQQYLHTKQHCEYNIQKEWESNKPASGEDGSSAAGKRGMENWYHFRHINIKDRSLHFRTIQPANAAYQLHTHPQ